ncbi:MAG TPA: hypothetical protein VF158_10840 [Longimicrobiales bacterium]
MDRETWLGLMRPEHTSHGRLARRWAAELLQLAGEGAARDEVERAAKERFSRMDTERRAALVEFGIEWMEARAGRPAAQTERHLDPSTIPPRRAGREETTMPGPTLTADQRARVRQIVREALESDPQAKPGPVHDQVTAEGISISYKGFRTIYWKPTTQELRDAGKRNGKKRTDAAHGATQQVSAAPAVPIDGVAAPVPAPAPDPAERDVVHGLRVEPLVGGEVHVRLDDRFPGEIGWAIAAAIGDVLARAGRAA